jgi:hypothetical protein
MAILFAPSSRRVRASLLACIAALVLAFAVTAVLRYGYGHDHVFGMVRLFDLDGEQNVPALFSALQLLACSAVLALIAAGARRRGDRDALHWVGLSAAFAFLGLDEATSLHETLWMSTEGLRPLVGASSAPAVSRLGWVLPYGFVVAGFAVSYLGFLWRLPRAIGVQIAVAGAAFVAGAVGIELVELGIRTTSPTAGLPIVLATTAQEVVEMVSIAHFLATLVRHVELAGGSIELRMAPAAASVAAPVTAPVASATSVPASVLVGVANTVVADAASGLATGLATDTASEAAADPAVAPSVAGHVPVHVRRWRSGTWRRVTRRFGAGGGRGAMATPSGRRTGANAPVYAPLRAR